MRSMETLVLPRYRSTALQVGARLSLLHADVRRLLRLGESIAHGEPGNTIPGLSLVDEFEKFKLPCVGDLETDLSLLVTICCMLS